MSVKLMRDVDAVYKLSTNRLATVPPSRLMSLVSELEQISPITKSRSSPEIPNIWWDIEQNTHQIWHYSNLKSKRNIELNDKPAADIALSEIHSSQFIWKIARSTHSCNKEWLLIIIRKAQYHKICLQLVVTKVLIFTPKLLHVYRCMHAPKLSCSFLELTN